MYRKTIRRFINYFSGNTWKKTGIVLGLTFMLTAWLFFLDSREELPVTEDGRPYLERNSYGEGERRETLTVEMEGEEDVKSGISAKRETLEIDVGEREYDPEEIRQVLENEAKRLESLILGENENLETVRKDLNLISSIPGTAIEVTWELSDYTIMDITGRLNADALKEDGTLLEVTAVLNYKEEILRYTFPVCVYAPQLNASEKFLKQLSDAVEDEEQSTRSSGRVILPQEESG